MLCGRSVSGRTIFKICFNPYGRRISHVWKSSMHNLTRALVLRAGYGIWLYKFLIIAYLCTFLLFWPLDSRTGLNGSHTGPQVYDSLWAFKIIVQAPCGSLMGSLRGFVRFRMGNLDWFCVWVFKTLITSARAHMTYVHAPYGFHRGRVSVLDPWLKAHKDPIESPYACDHVHRRRMISYGIPKSHRPVRLPKSYGPGITYRSHMMKA